uniref:RING-type domain-containing protein n=1 Tax=Percolomonas cosmopolitus TaxID=63605 RepID=A0A7S1PGL7_9EUKA|mmetsp:Transcript_3429/g.13048  ORF Transcript_3429/g.13048 Transcript_3429/m.13048 type:complete len:428 (+) Transcript_3429:117-1400(+)
MSQQSEQGTEQNPSSHRRVVFIQFHIPLDPYQVASATPSSQIPSQINTEAPDGQQTPNAARNLSAQHLLRLFSGFVPIHIAQHEDDQQNGGIPDYLLRDIAAGLFGHHGPPKPPSMDKKAREELPTFIYDEERATFMTHHATDGCTICLSDFECGECVTALPCGHYFHTQCVGSWIDEHNTCPTCRFQMKVTNEELERQRIEQMSQRYGKAGFHILQESSQIERLFSIVYNLKHGTRTATMKEVNDIDLQLEKIIMDLDALENLDEQSRGKRREEIVKIQHMQSMLGEVREKCKEEEQLDNILDSTLAEIVLQQKSLDKIQINNEKEVESSHRKPQKSLSRGTSSSQKPRNVVPVQTSEKFLSPNPSTPFTPVDLSLLFNQNSMDSFESSMGDKTTDSPLGPFAAEVQPPRKRRKIDPADDTMDIDE